MPTIPVVALCSVLLLLSGCSDRGYLGYPDRHNPAMTARGAELFRQHCAVCHGPQAEGNPRWRFRDAEGFFPPPPLDGSAHAWHHPLNDLRRMIRDGSLAGQGRMPAWGSKLSPQEIDAIIAWFQSLWSEEVYATWEEIDARARRAAK